MSLERTRQCDRNRTFAGVSSDVVNVCRIASRNAIKLFYRGGVGGANAVDGNNYVSALNAGGSGRAAGKYSHHLVWPEEEKRQTRARRTALEIRDKRQAGPARA